MKKGLSWVVALFSILGSCTWLAYVGSSVSPAHGARFFDWIPTLRCLLMGGLCLVTTFVALRGRNWFAFLFHAAVSLLGIWFAYLSVMGKPEQREPFSSVIMPPSLVPAICLLIVPGVFWYITGRASWPRLVSQSIPLTVNVGVAFGLFLATIVGAVMIDFMTIWSGECHYSPRRSPSRNRHNKPCSQLESSGRESCGARTIRHQVRSGADMGCWRRCKSSFGACRGGTANWSFCW
jgi:hypothetical protein